jgi:hypothetical protein
MYKPQDRQINFDDFNEIVISNALRTEEACKERRAYL